MNTPQDIEQKIAERTDEELLAMFGQRDDWTPEALEAARIELQKRNIDPLKPVVPTASRAISESRTLQSMTLADALIRLRDRVRQVVQFSVRAGYQKMSVRRVFLSFRGRVPRSTFWLCALTQWFLVFGVGVVLDPQNRRLRSLIYGGLYIFLSLPVLMLPLTLPVLVKRCHDRNRSGWFILIVFIAFGGASALVKCINREEALLASAFLSVVGSIWLLSEWGFRRGIPGENRFGRDPLQKAPDAA